jgi:hypothetical protein
MGNESSLIGNGTARLAYRVECDWSLWRELLQEGILGQPTILEWALTDETEAAAFTNLLMVGFDPMQMGRKHATSFHRRMLRETNAKGMEIVLHLLIQRIIRCPRRHDTYPNDLMIAICTVRCAAKRKAAAAPADLRLVIERACGETFLHMLWHFSIYAFLLRVRYKMQRLS